MELLQANVVTMELPASAGGAACNTIGLRLRVLKNCCKQRGGNAAPCRAQEALHANTTELRI